MKSALALDGPFFVEQRARIRAPASCRLIVMALAAGTAAIFPSTILKSLRSGAICSLRDNGNATTSAPLQLRMVFTPQLCPDSFDSRASTKSSPAGTGPQLKASPAPEGRGAQRYSDFEYHELCPNCRKRHSRPKNRQPCKTLRMSTLCAIAHALPPNFRKRLNA